MRFQIKHLLVGMTAAAVLLVVTEPELPRWLDKSMQTASAKPATTPVVVAAAPLYSGMALRVEYVTTREWPSEYVPAGAFTKVEDVLGRTVASMTIQGEPVLKGKVTSIGGTVPSFVKSGWRAYTISANPVFGGNQAGMFLPGNRVDILLTTSNNNDGGGTTTTIMQNVEVIAVNHFPGSEPGTKEKQSRQRRSVSLHVSSDMAAQLNLAQTKGTLALTLRGWNDESVAATRPITVNDLYKLEHDPRYPPADNIQTDR